MSESEHTAGLGNAWVGRARVVIAASVIWGALHYIAEAAVMPRGLDRPIVVTHSSGGIIAPLVVGGLLLLGAYIGALIIGPRRSAGGLWAVCIGLAVWTAPGGTMDHWLTLELPSPTQSPASAYWPLFIEYVFLILCMAGVLILSEFAALRTGVSDAAQRVASLRGALGLSSIRTELRQGVLALALTAGIGAVGMLFLPGPRIAATHRGQIYFAIAVGFFAATVVAARTAKVRHLVWYLPAPFIVGVIGVLVAGLGLRLPGSYSHLNNIPVFGLVRALPVEMMAVGCAAILWAMRSPLSRPHVVTADSAAVPA